MFDLKRLKSVLYPAMIGLICLVASGCGVISLQSTPTQTGTFLMDDSSGPETVLGDCPEEDTLFSLWYSHYALLDITSDEGDSFYLNFENVPPSYFDFWIFGDGSVSNEGIIREADIAYSGTARHPNSDDCPVQTFAGSWTVRAKISGTCENAVVRIHLVEEWVNPVLESDCGDAGPGQGLFSAPELDLIFDLRDPYPADLAEIPPGGPFQASYAYHIWPAGYELPTLPLVPESE